MDPALIPRAIATSISIAREHELVAERAIVLQDSNKLSLRLLPCDVVSRVALIGQGVLAFEVEMARQLAEVGAPTATLDPRIEARLYERAGFAVTFWPYYEPLPRKTSPTGYADALHRLHSVAVDPRVLAPHYTDRVAEAQQIVATETLSPELGVEDRAFLGETLDRLRHVVAHRTVAEQLLHGEPHPGNVLDTRSGAVFIDLETCCRGPVEFDVAHVPEAVSDRYPDIDQTLVEDCRHLVLAMVAAWRWERDDQFPNGKATGRELLTVLRAGPPWPTLDALFGEDSAR